MMDRDRQLADLVTSGRLHGFWGAGVMAIWSIVAVGAGFQNVPLRDHPLLLILVAIAIGYVAGALVGRAVLGGSGTAAQQVYLPHAAGTYMVQFSHIDALEAQGNYVGAVDAWEKVAIAQPANPWPLIRAGELYLRVLKDHALALERFHGARTVPGIAREPEMYASQKIIDLYLGPLADEGRALVELRRFAERHAGTREAAHALATLTRLKAGRRGEAGRDPDPWRAGDARPGGQPPA